MTDMIETVARAIATADEQNGGPPYEMRATNKHSREMLFDEAKAAIEAHEKALEAQGMVVVPREPTEAMAKAMLWAGITHGEDKTEWRCFEDAWQAGIDAAMEGK